MIASALVAALLAVLPGAPARGDSTVPLVHVVGWNRLITVQSGPLDWDYDAAEHDMAFTLDGESRVEVRLGGTCTVDGQPTHRSTLLHHAFCNGRDQ